MPSFKQSDITVLAGPVQRAIKSLKEYVDNREERIRADLIDVPWIAMNLTGTGWSNYGFGWAPAAYRRVGDIVQIRGLIGSGNVGNVIAVMPVGYRPLFNQIMSGQVDYGAGYQSARIDISTLGVLVPYWNGGAAGYLSINVDYSVV